VAKTELANMDSGAYSQVAFTRPIADLKLNATNIGLVSLRNAGLQYTESVPKESVSLAQAAHLCFGRLGNLGGPARVN
jgi:hypothetical protein